MRVTELEAFAVEAVKDESVPLYELPDSKAKDFLLELVSKPPAVLSEEYAQRNGNRTSEEILSSQIQGQIDMPFNDSFDSHAVGQNGYRLWQVNPEHARSYIVEHLDIAGGITDEFGNKFDTVTVKGNNYARPGIIESPTAANGIIAYGLQESATVERILKVSKVLRQHGIGTEYVMAFSEPRMIPYTKNGSCIEDEEYLGRNAFKQRLISDSWGDLRKEEQTFDKLFQFQEAIGRTTYYVTIRAMDTPYRLSDIQADPAAFEQVRRSLSVTQEPITEEEYYRDVYIPNLARNLAKMHSLGLVHNMLHSGNISAYGSIVDVDSVKGEILGFDDGPNSRQDQAGDIVSAMYGLPFSLDSTLLVDGQRIRPITKFLIDYIDGLSNYGEIQESGKLIASMLIGVKLKLHEYDADFRVIKDFEASLDIVEVKKEKLLDDRCKEAVEIYFHEHEDEIFAKMIESIGANIQIFTMEIADTMINEARDDLAQGNIPNVISKLNKFGDLHRTLYEFAKDGAAEIILAQAEEEGYSVGDVLAELDTRVAFRQYLYQLTGPDSQRWPEIENLLSSLITKLVEPVEGLHGKVEPMYLSGRGNLIFAGYFSRLDDLNELMEQENLPVINIDSNHLKIFRHKMSPATAEYRMSAGKRLIQILCLDQTEDGVFSYSYDSKNDEEIIELSAPTTGTIALLVEDEQGSRFIELYFDPDGYAELAAMKDNPAFASYMNQPVQLRLFKLQDQDFLRHLGDIKIRLLDKN